MNSLDRKETLDWYEHRIVSARLDYRGASRGGEDVVERGRAAAILASLESARASFLKASEIDG